MADPAGSLAPCQEQGTLSSPPPLAHTQNGSHQILPLPNPAEHPNSDPGEYLVDRAGQHTGGSDTRSPSLQASAVTGECSKLGARQGCDDYHFTIKKGDLLTLTQGVILEAGLLVQCSFSHSHLQTSALAPNLPILGN